MKLTYIVFPTAQDEERGFNELLRHTRLHAFPGRVYGVRADCLPVLDHVKVEYRLAADEEVPQDVPGREVRDPAASSVQ